MMRRTKEKEYSFVNRLNITCENEGCTTIVKLDALASHLTECDFNPKKLIECEKGCGMMISKENLTVNTVICLNSSIILIFEIRIIIVFELYELN